MGRGQLRIYLGAAPGVGKTFAMLNEGFRRRERGTNVVIGFVETHNRPNTAAAMRDLEVVPRHKIEYRGATFEEMDVDAVLARRPDQVLVDELAHTNVPGSRNQKRYQDIDELLEAGIDVISTVNIQHLESLNDTVEQITGVVQRETVPDAWVRRAGQIELVDMTPEALRRRMAHGNIYAADKIDAALGNYFRQGNLGALRELALLWLAERVDEALEEYRIAHGIDRPWETRERVVVAITGAPGGDHLIRRAARIALRAKGELLGVHITSDDGLAGPAVGSLDAHRRLLLELGGEYHEAVGSDIGAALVAFARSENATQIILGASRRTRWDELTKGSVVNRVVRLSGVIDVHVISSDAEQEAAPHRLPRLRPGWTPITLRRRLTGWLLAGLGLPLLTIVLTRLRDDLALSSVLLVYLALVVVIATIGGRLPALLAAVAASALVNWYFTPPIHTWTVGEGENVVALVVFVVVGGTVSTLVNLARRRSAEALRARSESAALARSAAELIGDDDPLPRLVDLVRETFGLGAVAVLTPALDEWVVEASAGAPVPAAPGQATEAIPLAGDAQLVLVGAPLAAEDLQALNAFAAQLSSALERRDLRKEADHADRLAEANDLRTALLRAVSHDLRTPLASIKLSVTSLLQHDVSWTPEATSTFLETIDEETDRLNTVVGNLLDMSRLESGALEVHPRPVGLEEVVAAALLSVGPPAANVVVDVPETLPEVRADAALLERAVANLVSNALTHTPAGTPVRVEAREVGNCVDLVVADRGPGVPAEHRDRVFEPFQRLRDSGGNGVGLGLAVARGFVEAVGGRLVLEETAGGGLTVVLTLPQRSAPVGAGG